MTHACPQCGEALRWTPAYPAEPEVNAPGWRGGWDCFECEFSEEVDEDDLEF